MSLTAVYERLFIARIKQQFRDLRQILVSLLSTARSTVTTYTFTSERVVYEKIPWGTRREVRQRVLFPEHTPMFHSVQYKLVGEAVPNGLLQLSF